MPADPRPLRLVAISAGTSIPSSTRILTDRLVAATRSELAARGHAVDLTVVEVRDLAHDVVDAALAGFPSPRLAAALESIGRADGVIAVSPTYNQSMSGLFKSLLDVIPPGRLAGVPVALGATGGTARHSLALDYAIRPVFAYLKADVVPTTIFGASEDFGAATGSDGDDLSARAGRVGTELADYMVRFAGVAGAEAPAAVAPTQKNESRGRTSESDDFTDFVPMADLLGS